jgi:hypothetical protein
VAELHESRADHYGIKRHNEAILALSADQQQGLPAGKEGT